MYCPFKLLGIFSLLFSFLWKCSLATYRLEENPMQHQLPQLYCMWSYWKLRLASSSKKSTPKSPTNRVFSASCFAEIARQKAGHQRGFFFPRFVLMHQTLPCSGLCAFFVHSKGTRKALPKYQQNQSNCDILVNYRSILLEICWTKLRWKLDHNGGEVIQASSPTSMTPQLTANWHPNFGSQLIHPFQIHMFRDILPKKNVQNPPGDDVPSKMNHFGASTSLKKMAILTRFYLFICDSKNTKETPSTINALIRCPVPFDSLPSFSGCKDPKNPQEQKQRECGFI